MAKECNKADEKLRFVARYLDGEKIAALCPGFGISPVTGQKIIDRYKDWRNPALSAPLAALICASKVLPRFNSAADGLKRLDQVLRAALPRRPYPCLVPRP